jgi:hypothetical protein
VAARVHSWLVRWRFLLLALFIAHVVAAHFFVIGFATWDGLGHRVPPVAELVQHGSYGLDKYFNWALVNFRPFIELTNAPFLWLFGLTGLFFAFAFTLFPFCVASIFLFARELTGQRRAAFYAAIAYTLLPIVNAQLEGGYIDWAVPGLIAFFLYALLGLRADAPRVATYGKVALGTFLFSMSRQQAPYLAVFFAAVVGALAFLPAPRLRPKVLGLGTLAFAVGLALPVGLQVANYLRYGSPIFPYQFNMLGLKIGEGASIQMQPTLFGLDEYSVRGLLKASLGAWLIPSRWPSCFYDARVLGAGLFFILAALTLPLSIPRANRETRVLLLACVAVSLGARDFWCPRFAYTLLLAIVVLCGLALASLVDRPGRGVGYVALLTLVALHALRPEWDVMRIKTGDFYVRMNVAGSPYYLKDGVDVFLYPDLNAQFVIAEAPGNGFALPLYGRRLTNTVLGSVHKEDIGEHCEGLHAWDGRYPKILVIDDENLTKGCERTCGAFEEGRCIAWQLGPTAPP